MSTYQSESFERATGTGASGTGGNSQNGVYETAYNGVRFLSGITYGPNDAFTRNCRYIEFNDAFDRSESA